MESSAHSKHESIVLIGGGPSALGFCVSILRSKEKANYFLVQNSVTVIEKGISFGPGSLEKYCNYYSKADFHSLGINSNTSAIGFLRLILREPECRELAQHFEDRFQELKDEKAVLKRLEDMCLPMFKNILHSNEVLELVKLKCSVVPLKKVGAFLGLVGKTILGHCRTERWHLTFKPHCEVTQIQIDDLSKMKLTTKDKVTGRVETLATKHVVIAAGGHPKPIIPEILSSRKAVYQADNLIKDSAPASLKLQELAKLDKKVKIAIIGASHSGFSAAWMLLQKINKIEPLLQKNFEIVVYHREKIKLSFNSKEAATKAGYDDYDENAISSSGVIYPFAGLRGDAKELFLNIKNGKETRISLVNSQSLQKSELIYTEADIIIQAFGYCTSIPKLIDLKGREITPYVESDGMSKIDKNCRLCLQTILTPKIYGIGLGFGISTQDSSISSEKLAKRIVRADSVQVYHTIPVARVTKAIMQRCGTNNENIKSPNHRALG